MTPFKLYDASNITSKVASSHGSIFMDGFRNDTFFRTFHPEYFGPEATAPESQRNQFAAIVARGQARRAQLKIMAGEATLAHAFGSDDDEPTATCFIDLPEAQRVKLTVWQWIKYKIYSLYVPIATYLDKRSFKELSNPEVSRFFKEMYTATGAIEGPEYYAKLVDMPLDELTQTHYPCKETLYIHILSVRSNCHGKGYGTKLLLWAIDQHQYLKGPVFTSGTKKSVQAPPKVSLFPTEGNETFYNRMGFLTVSSALVTLKGDEKFEHKYMERLLHNEV